MNLAVIPARGGSKRVPRKNIKDFCGKPIIAWSIEAALKSGCFNKVIVSTDDTEIAAVANDWGAEVPFMRPAELSDDYSGTIPVIAHAVDWYQHQGFKPQHVCCIYATAPFIQPRDLRQGLNILLETGCDYTFTVTRYSFPVQRAVRITASGRIEMFHPEHFSTRSQDLEEAYHDAGQFYWGRAEAWLSGQPIFTSEAAPIVLPQDRVQDIDTQEDWLRAELIYQALVGLGRVEAF